MLHGCTAKWGLMQDGMADSVPSVNASCCRRRRWTSVTGGKGKFPADVGAITPSSVLQYSEVLVKEEMEGVENWRQIRERVQ